MEAKNMDSTLEQLSEMEPQTDPEILLCPDGPAGPDLIYELERALKT